MPFSYFISCLWWICVLVHEWVYSMQLEFWIVSLSFSFPLFCPDSKDKTQSNKELESDKDREKIMSNYVKLKWLNLQNDLHFSVVFFSCHFLVCLREWNKDQLCETIPLKPTICPSTVCLLSCCSPANQKHWLSPWRKKAWWHHQTRFQNSRLSESHSLVERVYFSSKVNLTLCRVKVKWRFGFKMVWFSLLISLSSSLSDRANLSN